MPHIHTADGSYDQTASAFIIRIDGSEPRILLHRHKKLNRHLQFGGHIETNENPWQTIAHELQEEIGYTFEQLQVLQPKISLPSFEGEFTIIHPHPLAIVSHPYDLTLKHYHTDTSWVFVTDQDPLLPAGDDESKDVVTLTKSQLKELPKDDIFENIRVLSLYALDVCLPKWQRIPANEFRL